MRINQIEFEHESVHYRASLDCATGELRCETVFGDSVDSQIVNLARDLFGRIREAVEGIPQQHGLAERIGAAALEAIMADPSDFDSRLTFAVKRAINEHQRAAK